MDGCTTIEEKLNSVTGIIFNNWYALKLALDHGQGGPPGIQNVKIQNLLKSITSMVISLSNGAGNDCDDISEYLSDIMDDEFDVVLEDNSHVQVVKEIYDMFNLLRSGNDLEVINKISSLPIKTSILVYSVGRVVGKESQTDSSSSGDDNEGDSNMEQDDPDPGWTVVKHNRRK